MGAFLATFVNSCNSKKVDTRNGLELSDPKGTITVGSSLKIHSWQHQNASYMLFANETFTKAVKIVNGTVHIPSIIGTTGLIAMVSQVTKCADTLGERTDVL